MAIVNYTAFVAKMDQATSLKLGTLTRSAKPAAKPFWKKGGPLLPKEPETRCLPNETTTHNFRYFLKRYGLSEVLFSNEGHAGMKMNNGFGYAGYLGIHKQAKHKQSGNVLRSIARRPCTKRQLDVDELKAEKSKPHSGTPTGLWP
ncbi:hypothetical protein [Marinobacter sp. UBA2688]|uniref:hypothetical protein n=1 Tax=Marinobacter sp. UBA2688 TaxID=1946816 RepID=UPI00257B5BDC|nr:hypothetical protein [Marinobacter sp. UBA2688]|tara:strand:+ start:10417 stop:10854 length:438 start_codon:yes stop_codon:yes gene_type:complete